MEGKTDSPLVVLRSQIQLYHLPSLTPPFLQDQSTYQKQGHYLLRYHLKCTLTSLQLKKLLLHVPNFNFKVQSAYSMNTSKLVKRQIRTMLKESQGGRWILTEYSWMGSTMTRLVYKVS